MVSLRAAMLYIHGTRHYRKSSVSTLPQSSADKP
jgi:hypothetical protein